METWEMFRELAENPDKRFKSIHGDNLTASTYVEIGQGGFYFKNSKGNSIRVYFIGFDWVWEEVKQSVDFMEAFKALKHDRKDVTCELEGMVYNFFESDTNELVFNENLIEDGKWYIED